MNTIIDLNAATTVTYNDESSYSITFGTNFGNTTSNVDAYTSANITNQCNVTALSNAVRDLLIDVAFSNVGNVSVAYDGTFGNIGVLQIAPAAWRVTGIRTTGQYTEAMANVKYTDLTGASNVTPEYSYTTTVNDQAGNTRTWTTTVNVIQLPELAVSGPVIYDEDISANVTVLSVVVDPASLVPFTLYANVAAANGTVSNGIVVGNSVSISGNATQLNALLTANTITYLPASDLASNVANAITFALGNATTIFDTITANVQIGNSHADYYFPSTAVYYNNDFASFGNSIIDIDTRATSYTISLRQISGNIGNFYVNNVLSGLANTTLTLTNAKGNLNGSISWLPVIGDTGNVSFEYSQTKTTPVGNFIQANAVTQQRSWKNAGPDLQIIRVGNVFATSNVTNIGNSSISFNLDVPTANTLGYLKITDRIFGNTSNVFQFANSQSWTVEAFIYSTQPSFSSATQGIVSFIGDKNANVWLPVYDGSASLALLVTQASPSLPGRIIYNFFTANGESVASGQAIAANTWTHIAWSYDASTANIGLYVNGNLLGGGNISGLYANTGVIGNIVIGSHDITGGTDFRYPFRGYMDELRISNIARYTANFTPTTTAFTTDANTLLLLHGDDTANGGITINNDRWFEP